MKKAKVVPLYTPQQLYQMHIARANHIIFNEVLNNIKNQDNEQH